MTAFPGRSLAASQGSVAGSEASRTPVVGGEQDERLLVDAQLL